jgi:hypothetical protein
MALDSLDFLKVSKMGQQGIIDSLHANIFGVRRCREEIPIIADMYPVNSGTELVDMSP